MEFSFKLLYFYTIRFNSIVVAELVLNYIQGGSRCGMAKMRGKAGMGWTLPWGRLLGAHGWEAVNDFDFCLDCAKKDCDGGWLGVEERVGLIDWCGTGFSQCSFSDGVCFGWMESDWVGRWWSGFCSGKKNGLTLVDFMEERWVLVLG
jgi:hypothetical protein